MLLKSISISIILSLPISFLISIFTLNIKGRNVITGDPETLSGIKAIIYKIGSSGFWVYVQELIPTAIVLTIVLTACFYFKSNA